MIDTHSHILPGIDDGVPDMEQALETARLAVEDGIEGIVCTPHWVRGLFENTRDRVLRAVEAFRSHLAAHKIPLDLYPGAELRIDFEIGRKIRDGQLATLNDSGRYALIELPSEVIPPRVEDFFYSLQMAGIAPIIAHPERNPGLIKDPARLYGWIDTGILTQVTARSLLGRFGGLVQKFSVQLLEHRMVHLVATDAHGPKNRGPRLSGALEAAEGIVGESDVRRIFYDNPLRIVRGQTVVPFDPVPFQKRSSLSKRLFSFLGSGRR